MWLEPLSGEHYVKMAPVHISYNIILFHLKIHDPAGNPEICKKKQDYKDDDNCTRSKIESFVADLR